MEQKDKFIFTTGIVGRAMGSGKFTGGDIQALTDLAAQAFENTFGKFAEDLPPAAQTAEPATDQLPALVLPEAKEWNIWKKDRCSHWHSSLKDATWEWLLERAKAGDDKCQTAIRDMAVNDPGDPAGKWFKANSKRAARAKTVQLMLAQSAC